jgi:hypothetical protein
VQREGKQPTADIESDEHVSAIPLSCGPRVRRSCEAYVELLPRHTPGISDPSLDPTPCERSEVAQDGVNVVLVRSEEGRKVIVVDHRGALYVT